MAAPRPQPGGCGWPGCGLMPGIPTKLRFLAAPALAFVLRSYADLEDAATILYVRVFYGVTQAIVLLVSLAICLSIFRRNETKEIGVTAAAGPFDKEPPKKERMTIKQYELSVLQKEVLQICMQNFIAVGVFHIHMGYVQPLVLASLFGPLRALVR